MLERDIGGPAMTGDMTGPAEPAATAEAAAFLSVRGVGHCFGRTRVLSDVSVSAGRGEILGLLGPSGCGKSTLLRLIAGVEAHQEGRILLDGEELAGPRGAVPPEDRAIGFLPQDYALFPHLSVLDNVCFGLRGRSAAERKRRGLEALAGTSMADFAAGFPHQLSGGEQQRVALARALAPQPRLLLLDEPFANLDARLRGRLREDTLALLKRLGMTAVIVTHEPEEAMALGDRIALMDKGRIRQAGTPLALYRQPADPVVAAFFGEPNRLRVPVSAGGARTPFGVVAMADTNDGDIVEALIRPESLTLEPVPDPAPAAAAEPARGATGRVVASRFLGRITRIDVRIDTPPADRAEPPVLQVHLPGYQPATTGQPVRLHCRPEDVMVFRSPSLQVSP
jgi:iron(III) transport system ATP-binding protein